MIVNTASEIVRQAKWLSNTTNSPLTDFYINTNLLSSLYRDLYEDVIETDNQFVQSFETSDTEVDIDDVYRILWVGTKTGQEITRSSLRTRQTNGYYIENNKLYLPSGNKVIKYCTLPDTITVPDDPQEVDIELPGLMTNSGISTDLTITTESKFYHGKTIDFSNLPEWMKRDGVTIKNVNVSDPYVFVSYSDGKVRLYSDEYTYTDWNPNISKGKRFQGTVYAFTSDDSTGKGVLFLDELTNKKYYGSFVPDTVLSYPNNTFFTLLVYRLAAILASMVGIDNPYLTNTLLPQAETSFYKSISKGQASRVANVLNGGFRYV